MKFFLVVGTLFLVGAVYNLVQGDYPNMAGTLVFAGALFAIYFTRRRKVAADFTAISQTTKQRFAAVSAGVTRM